MRTKANIKSETVSSTLDTSDGPIPYFLQYSSRRKTMMIQIDERSRVRVVVPFYARTPDIQRFLLSKSRWIVEKIKVKSRLAPAIGNQPYSQIETGAEFLFLGKKFPLELQENQIESPDGKSPLAVSLFFDGTKWRVLVPTILTTVQRHSQIKERLLIWYQMQAKEILGSRVFHYARIMGVEPKNITIKSPGRLWGSCNYRKQTIHLNWHIVMSPWEVLDYVIVHELCHLKEHNHSPAFWSLVAHAIPEYREARRELRRYLPAR